MNLFLFAHQDDEYAVYSVLEQLVAQKQPLKLVYLTSGTPGGELSQRRNRESLQVLADIGIAAPEIYFIGADAGIPDAKLCQYLDRAANCVQQLYSATAAPTRIYTPAWEGGHQDHDATYLIACYLARRFDCVATSRQFPLYQGQGLPGSLWHTFAPLSANGAVEATPLSVHQRLRYLRYCLSYPSQWSSWLGLFPMVMLNLFTQGRQYLQPLLLERVAEDPHAGACLYQRRGACSREQFVACTRDFVDRI